VLLAIALLAPPPLPAAAASVHAQPPEPALHTTIDTVVLRADGLDAAALRAALTRRRPDLTVRDDAPPDVTRSAFVEVVAALPDVTLDVVLADGRAYHRTLHTGTAPGERAAARLLVQLLAAIAEQRVEPERRDVPIPAWTRDAAREPETTLAIPEPTPTIPDPPAVTEPPPQIREPPPVDPPAPTIKKIATRGPLELGLAADFTAALGLSPPRDVSIQRGLGGALRIDLRLPRGLVIGVAARGLARRADDLALARLRGAATLGYLHRRARLELLTSAGLSFETWRVRQAGDGVYYAEPGADTRPLLIGALARVAPGVRLTPGRRVAVRLGAWLELAGSWLPTGASARLARTHHDGQPPTPVFALGGLELAMGLELAAWFTLRRARP